MITRREPFYFVFVSLIILPQVRVISFCLFFSPKAATFLSEPVINFNGVYAPVSGFRFNNSRRGEDTEGEHTFTSSVGLFGKGFEQASALLASLVPAPPHPAKDPIEAAAVRGLGGNPTAHVYVCV